jgi:predicted phage-related endonuclease
MKFQVIDHPQRSPEWFAARAGRLTGSVACDMLARIKSGEAAARRDLRVRLAVERLTGLPQEDGFINPAMQRGIDCEPQAFAAFEAHTGEMVRRTGFLSAEGLMVGASLDGDINDFEGILECKCPKSATHVGYLRAQGLPQAHVAQVTHNLWVSGAKWLDFCSWDDRLPAPLHFFHVRVYAKDLDIASYEAEALKFLAEVDAEVDALKRLGAPEKRAAA